MPGSGKGTQGSVLGQLPDLVHVSSGDVFRKLPKYGSLGREIGNFTSEGLMVPDELTIRIYQRHIQVLELQEFLIPGRTTLVLDGIPRNYAQAERMEPMLDVVQIFHLAVQDVREATERLKARALRENRLDDMNDEVIRKRMKVYNEETMQTLSFYDPSIILDVDATQSPIDVLRDIVNRLAQIQRVKHGPAPAHASPNGQ
jgi:adenylate kinase